MAYVSEDMKVQFVLAEQALTGRHVAIASKITGPDRNAHDAIIACRKMEILANDEPDQALTKVTVAVNSGRKFTYRLHEASTVLEEEFRKLQIPLPPKKNQGLPGRLWDRFVIHSQF